MAVISRLLQDILLSNATARPQHTALVTENVRLSYREITDYACRLAHALRASGIQRGDRVAIFMDNGWQCAAAIFGVLLAGGVFVVINCQTKAKKLGFILQDSGSKILLTQSHLGRIFETVAVSMPALPIWCAALSNEALPSTVTDLAMALADQPITPPPSLAISVDLAALIYTSGTTSEPKGVMHTHQSLLFVLESINEYLGISQDERLFSVLPLNFGYGLLQWFSAVKAGATLVLERSFTYPTQVFRQMQEEAVTSFASVPTVYAMMLAHDARQSLCFPSIRRITNAAAALPVEFLPGIRRLFPQARLYKMYGQTECIRSAYLDPALAEKKPESVGRAIPGTELLLLDENGQSVGPDQVGILYVRGPHIMRGYWNQPEKTAEALVPGAIPGEFLLKSGDLFRRDAEGDFYFVARGDEIIKSRGEKVSPEEVENAIYSLSAVREVVVAGFPDPVLGQAVCAFVTLREDAKLTVSQIKRVCSERLESYMVPKYILIVSELPHTLNGKLSRRLALKEYHKLLTEAA